MLRNIRLLGVVLLLTVTAVGCGGGNSSAYAISGTVRSSGAGLQGVIVTLGEISWATATTDASGYYAIQNVPKGNYIITPKRSGYTFNPSTLTAVVRDANVDSQDFIVTMNSSLNCTAGNGTGTNGIQFYNYSGIVALNSTATANSAETSTLTWQVQYQNIYNLSADAYSGSLRARLWAIPYSVSSGVFDNAYVIGEFYPSFTGTGAASSGQLYVGSTSAIQVTSSTEQNPPPGEYCIVAVLEEYNDNSAYCSSPDHYCVDDWWQSGNSWIFY
jgi:Carboxypeptidase regulatory-like domain